MKTLSLLDWAIERMMLMPILLQVFLRRISFLSINNQLFITLTIFMDSPIIGKWVWILTNIWH
jgi:hypothetical protein